MSQITWLDLTVLARTVYGEARGEGREGMAAVANVVLNRVRDNRWPNTIHEVCRQPRQFSCWDGRSRNHQTMMKAELSNPFFRIAVAVAAQAIAGELPDETRGANHFLTKSLYETSPPIWADPEKVTCTIGNHVFLRL